MKTKNMGSLMLMFLLERIGDVGSAMHNTLDMQPRFLLIGLNNYGKSSLRSGICEFRVMMPNEFALIPHFDSIMLHMKSMDNQYWLKKLSNFGDLETEFFWNGQYQSELIVLGF